MHRILVADPLDPVGLQVLREAEGEVYELSTQEHERLSEIIKDYDALVVRSATKVDADVLRAGRRLRVVGRAGIGVDNIDVAAATDLGILVVNAPTANVVSATEHTFALLLALVRNIPAADASVKVGEWDRKRFLGSELQGKALGIVGFGRIGQRVAARARAFEMKVIAHDPFLDAEVASRLGVELVPLAQLLQEADVVTLHIPLTDRTGNLFNRKRILSMKPGAMLVNCARGGVVDEAALLEALESGRLAGVGLDVYAEEPPRRLDLVRHPRVVATPHIGGQTREAQERISVQTARMVLAALEGSLAVSAINLPFASTSGRGEPYLRLAEQLGQLAGSLAGGSVKRLQVELWGIGEELRQPITVAALKGALTPFLGEAVNYVNAVRLATGRGIEVVRSTHSEGADYPQLVAVRLKAGEETVELAGTIFGGHEPRVVRFGGFPLEFRPEGRLLVVENRDVPGVVGKLGTLLGQAGINIADIHLSRTDGDDNAVAVLRLDQEVAPTLLEELRALPEVFSARVVKMR